jgi:hypothetical protein
LFINSTPPGQLPLIVKAAVPTAVLLKYIPEFSVATTLVVPSHPAFTASVRKLALFVLLAMEKENWFALP